MRFSKTLVALFAAMTCLAVRATNPTGLHASMDIAVIEQAKDVYMGVILQFLNNLQLPDLGDDKEYLRGNHVSVSQDPQNVEFDVDVANNAITLTCRDLSANFYSDAFRAKSLIFVAKGHLEVQMDTVAIGLGLKFKTQTLPDGRIVPAVESVDVLVDINRNDIDIKIWGNIWADFAAAFEIFFKSTVVQLIQDSVRTTLTTVVPAYLNAEFAKTDGDLAIPTIPEWMLDWQTPLPATVTETSFMIGGMGIMYDTVYGEAEWSTAFVDMPFKDSTQPAQFQAYLSTLSVDSLMGSWLEVGEIAGWVYGDAIPKFNSTLTASSLAVAFPGLPAKYGDDAIVDVHVDVTALHDFTSSYATQDVSVYGTAKLQLWPRFNGTTELALEFDLIDVLFTGGIAINDFIATADVHTFLVDKITIDSSTIGSVSALKLKLEINNVSRILVPIINAEIQKYQVPIPSNVFGIFLLSDLYLIYQDGYLQAGATPTFLPPAAATPELIHDEAQDVHIEQF